MVVGGAGKGAARRARLPVVEDPAPEPSAFDRIVDQLDTPVVPGDDGRW